MASSHNIVLNPYAESLVRIKTAQLCRRADIRGCEAKDLQQRMRLYLVKVSPLYDPERASPETFIARAIDSIVGMILRERRRDRHRLGYISISIEVTIADQDGEDTALRTMLSEDDQNRRTGNQSRDHIQDIERREFVAAALARMPEELRPIAERLMLAKPTAVARELGVSRRQINNAIAEMRKYFDDPRLGS